jgi:phenylacetate-coenzyme A ligase PaaK-like adenylate-forming protein
MNWGHAFVRYLIEDRGTLVNEDCRCGHVGIDMSELTGRERATHGSISAQQVALAIAEARAGVKQY